MSVHGLRHVLESRMALLFLIPVSIVTAGIIMGGSPFQGSRGSIISDIDAASDDELAARLAIRVIAVSEDGAFLDVGQGDGDFVRRDALTGRKLHELDVPRGKLPWLQFSGRHETWAGVNLRDQLEFIRDGARLWHGTLPEQRPRERLAHCALCLDHRLLVVASEWGSLWLLEFDEEAARPRGRYSVEEPLADAMLSPTGELLALVTEDWQYLLWDINREQVVTRLETEGQNGRFASWSGDGRRLITFCYGSEAAVWEVPAGQLVRRLNVESKSVSSAALSEDGTLAAIGDEDTIRLWDLETGTELPSLTGYGGIISVLHFADKDRTLFSGDTKGGLRRWSLTDYREIWAVR